MPRPRFWLHHSQFEALANICAGRTELNLVRARIHCVGLLAFIVDSEIAIWPNRERHRLGFAGIQRDTFHAPQLFQSSITLGRNRMQVQLSHFVSCDSADVLDRGRNRYRSIARDLAAIELQIRILELRIGNPNPNG